MTTRNVKKISVDNPDMALSFLSPTAFTLTFKWLFTWSAPYCCKWQSIAFFDLAILNNSSNVRAPSFSRNFWHNLFKKDIIIILEIIDCLLAKPTNELIRGFSIFLYNLPKQMSLKKNVCLRNEIIIKNPNCCLEISSFILSSKCKINFLNIHICNMQKHGFFLCIVWNSFSCCGTG